MPDSAVCKVRRPDVHHRGRLANNGQTIEDREYVVEKVYNVEEMVITFNENDVCRSRILFEGKRVIPPGQCLWCVGLESIRHISKMPGLPVEIRSLIPKLMVGMDIWGIGQDDCISQTDDPAFGRFVGVVVARSVMEWCKTMDNLNCFYSYEL